MSGNVLFAGTYDKMLSSRAHTQCSKVEDWVLFICSTMGFKVVSSAAHTSSIELPFHQLLNHPQRQSRFPFRHQLNFYVLKHRHKASMMAHIKLQETSVHTHYARTAERREEKIDIAWRRFLCNSILPSPGALQSEVRGFYNVIWGRFHERCFSWVIKIRTLVAHVCER